MKRSMWVFAVLMAGIGGAAGVSRAEGGACQADVQKFCSDITKGEGRVMACLKAHGPDLSAPCKVEIRQKRKELREKMKAVNEACGTDRQKFCSEVQPGAGRIKDCMSRHSSELSGACRAIVDQKASSDPS